ncbi:hypothetical protein [Bacillus infantis]
MKKHEESEGKSKFSVSADGTITSIVGNSVLIISKESVKISRINSQ